MVKRVLLVSNTFPADPERAVHGIYQRLDAFMRALAGHRIEALFFVPPETDRGEEAIESARARLAETWGVDLSLELCPRAAPGDGGRWGAYVPGIFSLSGQSRYRLTSGSEQVAAVRRRLAEEPDAVFAHRLTAMAPLLELPASRAPTFFDLDDIEHVAFERRLRTPPPGPGKRLLRLQLPALKRAERTAIERCAATFVCSESDRSYLFRTYETNAVEVVPNAVEIPPPTALGDAGGAGYAGERVLFLGSFAYSPNQDAAERLLQLWPRVRGARPTARLVLAGPDAHLVSGHGRPPDGVEFPGFVDDLGGLYRSTSVVCAPITAGGGTRVKLLEAGAWARPIVATRIAAEGIGFEDGVHYLEREDDAALAAAVVALLEDRNRRRRLGEAARELVERHYSKDGVVARIREIFARHGLPAAAGGEA